MHGSLPTYRSPVVMDYGDLRDITAVFDPLAGARDHDLSFSAPGPPSGPGPGYEGGYVGGVVAEGGVSAGDSGGSGGSSGGGTGGGGGGDAGGGGGGGQLPFTGLAVHAVAVLGGAMTAAGTALRRHVRKRP